MIQFIRNIVTRRHSAQTAADARACMIREVREALTALQHARAAYDAVLESVTWTEDRDRRIEAAHLALKAAEERYALLMSYARGAGVRAGWEDVEAV